MTIYNKMKNDWTYGHGLEAGVTTRAGAGGPGGGAGNGSGNGQTRDPGDDRPDTGVLTEVRPKTKKPSMYKVLLLNDDYTPMEFVVHVLQHFFRLSIEDATRVMLQVHHKGVGVCGVFTFEVAETKVTAVTDFARKEQHPLQCTLEKE